MQEAVGERANVQWVERVATYYAGFSLIQSTLVGLRAIAAAEPTSHTVILSGQDYPARPTPEIEKFFEQQPGQELRRALRAAGGRQVARRARWARPDSGTGTSSGSTTRHGRFASRSCAGDSLDGLQPYGGGAWCALSHDAVRYIASFAEERPEVVRFFRHVKIPDEIFVQTVLLNSPLRDTVVGDDVHYIDWSHGGAHPKVLGTEDYDKIVESGKLFARKFDPRYDMKILDMLDARR